MSLIDNLAFGTRKYSKKFEQWCDPVYQYYGFTNAAYVEVTDSNSVINIHTHVDWLEHCMDQKYFINDPHMICPKNMGNGFIFWSTVDDPEYVDKLHKDANKNYNMCHGITFVEKGHDRCKVFALGTSLENYSISNKILENPQYIKKFIKYLDEQLNSLREELFNIAPDLSVLKGEAYYSQPGIIPSSSSSGVDEYTKKLHFLKQLELVDDAIFKLTKREIDCLKLYLEGQSASQTANILFISPRTVESHIENIKNKLNVHLKKELFERTKILKEVNLI